MAAYTLDSLLEIMAYLRSEQGCPWDKKQTHETLKRSLIEEAYEVIDAIDQQDDQQLADELGDLLLQIVFHAQIGVENGTFSITNVITAICEKMIRRHPHVFGTAKVDSVADVLTSWDEIKKHEQANEHRISILDGVPRHLPALMRAEKTQSKAAKVGFEWDTVQGALDKLSEELDEFQQAVEDSDAAGISEELGDILFSFVNVARYLKVDPEAALNNTTAKFTKRFHYIEEQARRQNISLEDMDLAQMDLLWEAAKKDSQS